MNYETAKHIAAHGDDVSRLELAKDNNAPTEILYYLATDDNTSVRQAVATNFATPLQADFLLTHDLDDGIRHDLAKKIGKRLNASDADADEVISQRVNKVLENLINDQLVVVRRIIADEIKQLESVPKGVVTKLARDTEAAVAAPILEHSPILDDAELIEIISAGIQSDAVTAIARRQNIGAGVSQSITETRHVQSIGTLLNNKSAQIDASTFVEIASIAEDEDALHMPLAERNDLPEPVLRRMVGFVSDTIVNDLIARYPLTEANQEHFRARVSQRLKKAEHAMLASNGPPNAPSKVLLAEDDQVMRSLIRDVIQNAIEADVTVVEDGAKALHLIDSGQNFDLIVSDWMMPKLTGIELLRTLRKRGNTTRFAMLTARKDVDSIIAAQYDGVDAFIAKPVSAGQLKEKIRVLLR